MEPNPDKVKWLQDVISKGRITDIVCHEKLLTTCNCCDIFRQVLSSFHVTTYRWNTMEGRHTYIFCERCMSLIYGQEQFKLMKMYGGIQCPENHVN